VSLTLYNIGLTYLQQSMPTLSTSVHLQCQPTKESVEQQLLFCPNAVELASRCCHSSEKDPPSNALCVI